MASTIGGVISDMTDEMALAAVARGDQAALEVLFHRHARAARGAALRVVGDPALADDLTQEFFARVWTHAASFDPARGRASSWLLTIARNLALNEVKRRRVVTAPLRSWLPGESPEEHVPDPRVDVEEAVCAAERRRLVAGALGALPPAQRAVIEKSFFGGLSLSQIAAALSIPLGTAKSRLSGGLRRLRAATGLRSLAPASTHRNVRRPAARSFVSGTAVRSA